MVAHGRFQASSVTKSIRSYCFIAVFKPVGQNRFMESPNEGVGHIGRETFDAFLQLSASWPKIIRVVILTFARANGAAEVPAQK